MHLIALNCVAIILLATVYKHTVMKTSLASKAIVYPAIPGNESRLILEFRRSLPVNETMYFIGQNETTSEYNL